MSRRVKSQVSREESVKEIIATLPIQLLKDCASLYTKDVNTNAASLVEIIYRYVPGIQTGYINSKEGAVWYLLHALGHKYSQRYRAIETIMGLDGNLIYRYMMAFDVMYSSSSREVTREMAETIYDSHNSKNSSYNLFNYRTKDLVPDIEKLIETQNALNSKTIQVNFYNLERTPIPYPEEILQSSFIELLGDKYIEELFMKLFGYKEFNKDEMKSLVLSALNSLSSYGWTSPEGDESSVQYIGHEEEILGGEYIIFVNKYHMLALQDLLSRSKKVEITTHKFVDYLTRDGRGITYIGDYSNYGKITTKELSRLMSIDMKYIAEVTKVPQIHLLMKNNEMIEKVHQIDLLLDSYIKNQNIKIFDATLKDISELQIKLDKTNSPYVQWKMYGFTLRTLPLGLASYLDSPNILSTRSDGEKSVGELGYLNYFNTEPLKSEVISFKYIRKLIRLMNRAHLSIPIITGNKIPKIIEGNLFFNIYNLKEIAEALGKHSVEELNQAIRAVSSTGYTIAMRNSLRVIPPPSVTDPLRLRYKEDFLADQVFKGFQGFQNPFEHIEFSLLGPYAQKYILHYPGDAENIFPVPESLTVARTKDLNETAIIDRIMFGDLELLSNPTYVARVFTCAMFGVEITSLESVPGPKTANAYVNICQTVGRSNLSLNDGVFTPIPENIIDWIESFGEQSLMGVKALANLLHIPHSEFISKEGLINALRVGNLNDLGFSREVLKRILVWESFPEYKQIIASRYYIDSKENQTPGTTFVYNNKPSENFEKVLEIFNPKTADKIVKTYHISVPSGVSSYKYLENNLHSYANVLDRDPKDESIEVMSDGGIIKMIGVYVGHISRDDLVAKAKAFLDGETMFFIPLVRNSINKYTLTSVPPYDEEDEIEYSISNPKLKIVGYGTSKAYYAYETTDFEGSFLDDKLSILNPKDIGTYIDITVPQASQLINLVAMYTGMKETIEKIEASIQAASIGNERDLAIYKEYKTFGEVDRNLLKKCFEDLFYLGMYFRHWLGPGNAFPSKESQTISSGFDGNRDSASTMHSFITHYEKLSLKVKEMLDNLMTYEHKSGTIILGKYKFIVFWESLTGASKMRETEKLRQANAKALEDAAKRMTKQELEVFRASLSNKIVAEGQYCIRMASTILVGTGHYYAKLLFSLDLGSEEVGGYNPKNMVNIL
jgi:hypothetical protein